MNIIDRYKENVQPVVNLSDIRIGDYIVYSITQKMPHAKNIAELIKLSTYYVEVIDHSRIHLSDPVEDIECEAYFDTTENFHNTLYKVFYEKDIRVGDFVVYNNMRLLMVTTVSKDQRGCDVYTVHNNMGYDLFTNSAEELKDPRLNSFHVVKASKKKIWMALLSIVFDYLIYLLGFISIIIGISTGSNIILLIILLQIVSLIMYVSLGHLSKEYNYIASKLIKHYPKYLFKFLFDMRKRKPDRLIFRKIINDFI